MGGGATGKTWICHGIVARNVRKFQFHLKGGRPLSGTYFRRRITPSRGRNFKTLHFGLGTIFDWNWFLVENDLVEIIVIRRHWSARFIFSALIIAPRSIPYIQIEFWGEPVFPWSSICCSTTQREAPPALPLTEWQKNRNISCKFINGLRTAWRGMLPHPRADGRFSTHPRGTAMVWTTCMGGRFSTYRCVFSSGILKLVQISPNDSPLHPERFAKPKYFWATPF